MKIEEQRVIRVDGKYLLNVWKDIDIEQFSYEVAGQTQVEIAGPQGVMRAAVPFSFKIEAESVAGACVGLEERIKLEAEKAAADFIANMRKQQHRIQVAGEGMIPQIMSQSGRPNGHP